MKAITLWQPWATLIALGEKKIETRSWSTNYRGTLAIHAAKQFTDEHMELCSQQPFLTALKPALTQYRIPFHFPRGAIVAVCELDFCWSTNELSAVFQLWNEGRSYLCYAPHNRAFGDYSANRFAWFLKNIHALPEPVPTRGYQQLWTVPTDIEKQIGEQLR